MTTVSQLRKIIKNPEKKEFGLEQETIDYIKSEKFDAKLFIDHVKQLDSDLEFEVKDNPFEKHGHKILLFLVSIWKKVFPIVDEITDALVNVGTQALTEVIEPHVPGYLKDVVKETIDTVGDGIKEVDDLVNDLVISTVEQKEVEEKEVDASGVNGIEETI